MTTKPEILEAAEHIVDFYRRTYPRTHWAEGEITLAKKIEGLSGGVEVKKRPYYKTLNLGGHHIKIEITDRSIETGGGNCYEERWRAKRLRGLYERGDEAEIFNYGKGNINCMTGGCFGNMVPHVGFHNETTQNHFRRLFRPDDTGNPYRDYAQESGELTSFYRTLVEESDDIEAKVLEIRNEICADQDFNRSVDEAVREARERTCMSDELDAPRSGLYQLEEFRRRDRVIPLIKRVERLYTATIDLTKAVIEVSRRPAT